MLKGNFTEKHFQVKPANFRKITPAIEYLQIPTLWLGNLGEQFDAGYFNDFIAARARRSVVIFAGV